MKKQIVLATAATLLTSSAWATKARMNALGQDTNRGSFYIKDSRSVFRNAAHVNSMNNYVVTEWGDAAGTTQKAEGGFFRSAGAFAYGIYMNSDITDQAGNTALNGYADALDGSNGDSGTVFGETGFKDRSNDLDLFFGGDMGIEWGARLHYAKGNAKNSTAEQKQDTLGLGLGVVAGDLNAYINYVLNDVMKVGDSTSDKWEDDGSMNIGVGYNWMDFTFYVDYDKKGAKYTNGTAAANTTEQTTLTVGAGYTKEVSSTSRMFTNVSYVKVDAEDKDGTTTSNNMEASYGHLPVVVGFEADANSWLTLRGSISQDVLINKMTEKIGTASETEASKDQTTNVQAGATLNFGKLKIDGMIGTGGTAGDAAQATTNERGTLSLDRLMTQVAVHYWF
ncbi:MAG: hypothetical protein GY909_14110 [Oligoflexia bacterium]|nr:hypothetical protein [Oligoflexia bacterium]